MVSVDLKNISPGSACLLSKNHFYFRDEWSAGLHAGDATERTFNGISSTPCMYTGALFGEGHYRAGCLSPVSTELLAFPAGTEKSACFFCDLKIFESCTHW